MIPDLLFIGILLENTLITEIEFNVTMLTLIKEYFTIKMIEYQRLNEDIVLCHKSPERNCVTAKFNQHDYRKWQHFCFTGESSSVSNKSEGNFTLTGYLNGEMIESSKC